MRVKRSPQYDNDANYPDYEYNDYESPLGTRCGGGRGRRNYTSTTTSTTRAGTTTTGRTIPTFPPIDLRVREQSFDYQGSQLEQNPQLATDQGQSVVFQ